MERSPKLSKCARMTLLLTPFLRLIKGYASRYLGVRGGLVAQRLVLMYLWWYMNSNSAAGFVVNMYHCGMLILLSTARRVTVGEIMIVLTQDADLKPNNYFNKISAKC